MKRLVYAGIGFLRNAPFRILNPLRSFLIYSLHKDIVLLKSRTDEPVYIFRKTAGLLNKKNMGCIYVLDEDTFRRYVKKAKVIFDWGESDVKGARGDARIFHNIGMPTHEQHALMIELGIENHAACRYASEPGEILELGFPIPAKPVRAMRREGIRLLRNEKELVEFSKSADLKGYLFSEYIRYGDYECKWRLGVVDDVLLRSYIRLRERKGYVEPRYSAITKADIISACPPSTCGLR